MGPARLLGGSWGLSGRSRLLLGHCMKHYERRVCFTRFWASGAYKRAIVPEQKGRFVLPPIRIVTFSPILGDYAVLEGPSFELEVAAGDAKVVAQPFSAPDLQVSAPEVRDILPLRPSASLSHSKARAAM